MTTTTGLQGGRPLVAGLHGVVATGHYLATECGMQLLRSGGNAVDAAAAAGFALTVVQPHQNGIGGEVPTLIYEAGTGRVHAVSGHGIAPAQASVERFRSLGVDVIPGDGFLPALVPPAVGSWIRMVERFGTKRLADLLEPAVQLARDGFPMYDALRDAISGMAQRFRGEWPSSSELYLQRGEVPGLLTVFRNPAWAATFERLMVADRRKRRRADGFRAAYELFYGEIAREIVRFAASTPVRDASGTAHPALLTEQDFQAYDVRFEDAPSVSYRGIEVHKCGPWTQGPVLLQSLKLAERAEPRKMGHNSTAYIHFITECMKLAFADRELYYGDPRFAAVPLEKLLSEEYAAERFRLVDARHASLELRPGSVGGSARIPPVDIEAVARAASSGDTTKLEVIDAAGNMVSATPSGGWLQSSPVIPGLGFSLGTRGQMFSLEPGHPNCVQPGKRPRTTLTPSLATREGRPFLAFGSPGGDKQDQWALQFLLNVVEFGMSLQEAVEAPTFWTAHFPSSFYPRAAEPGSLYVEGRIPASVQEELRSLGHRLIVSHPWSGGNTLAASIDESSGVLSAAASPRLDPAYAAAF